MVAGGTSDDLKGANAGSSNDLECRNELTCRTTAVDRGITGLAGSGLGIDRRVPPLPDAAGGGNDTRDSCRLSVLTSLAGSAVAERPPFIVIRWTVPELWACKSLECGPLAAGTTGLASLWTAGLVAIARTGLALLPTMRATAAGATDAWGLGAA